MRLLLFVLVGAALGYGWFRLTAKSTGGACPLMCDPWRASLFGALMGFLWAGVGGPSASAVGRDVSELVKGNETMAMTTSAAPVKLTEQNFEATIKGATTPILIDAYADWCGPCRMLAPELETVAKELEGKLLVGKVNTETDPGLAAALGVRSIPALFLVKDGKLIDQWVGFAPAQDLIARVSPALD